MACIVRAAEILVPAVVTSRTYAMFAYENGGFASRCLVCVLAYNDPTQVCKSYIWSLRKSKAPF